ncbi:ferrous iron transport protein A [Neokomagataea thailandica NBRC 106555]|uniref:Ferrous iron transport protein A n=2 Tax=Neokomagataea TaxID=1223423 RepID=A0A4Y6V7I6_9PROT|nr:MULTISPECIES: FeoA family protein [Neokomagataea]QDH24496.1 ferrous iron transport protein A [Neokomagataea tanensis]GBR53455.1 ferrous iron transport protein A [Neokomagataea thailandica NBRC 106555]
MQTLATLPKDHEAIIADVTSVTNTDVIALRLGELGFVPGERVEVIATGPFGHEPIAVRLGTSRFALRHSEAARIHLQDPK